MDIKKIKKLIELLEQSGISEMEIKEGKESIRLCKQIPVITSHLPQIPQTIVTSPPFGTHTQSGIIHPNQYHHQSSLDSSILKEAKTSNNSNFNESIIQSSEKPSLKSPMVGTFYRATSPEAKPFVALGDRVNIGDTLCIIEAMKMFNQIEAECSGTIESILVESGQPVEFGQPLFSIIPD